MSVGVLPISHEVSVRGKRRQVPAWNLGEVIVVTRAGVPRIAEIFDEYWLEARRLPNPQQVLEHLSTVERKPDLFTFAQRAPHAEPRYDFHREWDNVAVIPITTHERWMKDQISSASRRNIRSSEKKGIRVGLCHFDEPYIRGIMSIFNESPTRHGRRYWHYGKSYEEIAAENGTYRERSSFLGAFVGYEMVGYTKIVWDVESAAIMQILSKMAFFDRRPNNAMLSEAVRLCAERNVPNLLYESFVYGKKADSSLTRFKRENGFVRMDLPRYYVPLTPVGRLSLALGLHKNLKDRLPYWLTSRLLKAREQWYEQRAEK